MKIQKFLKFGKYDHLNELIEGYLYINHSSFFKQPIDHGIYDLNEGLQSIKHINDTYIELKPNNSNEWKKLKVTTGKLQSWNDLSDVHIFSLYQITEDECKSNEFHSFSDQIRSMGDYFLIINNPKVFVERLNKGLEMCNYIYESRSISYYDSEINQKNISAFHKSKTFNFQNEFRYLIKGNTKEPLRLRIESLNDIAEICETKKFNGLEFVWEP